MNIFTGLKKKINSLFNWKKSEDTVNSEQKTKRSARRPVSKDWTERYNANLELTKGLYHNTYPGFKLSAGLAFPMISIPVYFMGYPIVKTVNENEELDQLLEAISERLMHRMKQIHIQCHREGTIWVYPKFDSELMDITLEFIPDDTVTDIIKDLNTGRPIAIYTDEQMQVSTAYNQTTNVRRIRIFTKDRIQVQYKDNTTGLPTVLKDKTMRNPTGMMPIPFSNNADGDEVRGHSDLERVVSLLKVYHDISLAEADLLAKFKAKMIQEVQDVDKWLANNGLTNINEFDIAAADLFLNLKDKEKTDFAFPERATDAYREAKKQLFKLIVQTGGVPEIAYGTKTEGNANTAEEQMANLVQFTQDKQEQKTNPYEMLYQGILRLWSIVLGRNFVDIPINVTWNDLDAISEKVRSEIFKNFAEGLSKIMDAASATKQMVYNLWVQNFPKATTEDFEDFIVELDKMGKFKQFRNASLMEGSEFQGFDGNGNISSSNEPQSNSVDWDKLLKK